jgi:hypothetical protein
MGLTLLMLFQFFLTLWRSRFQMHGLMKNALSQLAWMLWGEFWL